MDVIANESQDLVAKNNGLMSCSSFLIGYIGQKLPQCFYRLKINLINCFVYNVKICQNPYILLTLLELQLNVRTCNACRQRLPVNFVPPAVEPWTTGIFDCTEDTESCKSLS